MMTPLSDSHFLTWDPPPGEWRCQIPRENARRGFLHELYRWIFTVKHVISCLHFFLLDLIKYTSNSEGYIDEYTYKIDLLLYDLSFFFETCIKLFQTLSYCNILNVNIRTYTTDVSSSMYCQQQVVLSLLHSTATPL